MRTSSRSNHQKIDSALSPQEALLNNPDAPAPAEIVELQAVVPVRYVEFRGESRKGQIVADKRLRLDIENLFKLFKEIGFPIGSAIPVSDPKIGWSDERSMSINNSSGWNYRPIYGQDKDGEKLSLHAYGWAIDINPRQNPWIKDNRIVPRGAIYDPERPGTLHGEHPAVLLMEKAGWTWGGRWEKLKDYQHFEKSLTPAH